MPAVAASSSGRGTSVASLTVSHTVPAGTDRLLVVFVNCSAAMTLTATYGGTPLLLSSDVPGGFHLVVFTLAAPTVGTANVVLTSVGAVTGTIAASVMTLTGCTALGGLATASGTSTAPSVTVTSAAGELVLDLCATAAVGITFTVGAGQTSILEQDGLTGSSGRIAVSSKPGAATVTMSWALSTSAGWTIGALTAYATAPVSALAIVQATPATSTTSAASVAVTFSTTPVVGNAIVLAVCTSPHTTAAITVTDTAGNAYTLAKKETHTTGSQIAEVWVCPATTATASPFTITAAGSGSNDRLAVALEVSGVGVGLVVDQTAGAVGAAGTQQGVGPTGALSADSLLVSAVAAAIANTVTVQTAPPWTSLAERVTAPITAEVDSRLLTGATGTTPSVMWTLGASGFSARVLVACKAGAPLLVTVPDVVGETEAAADTLLVAAGLTTGTVTPAASDTVASGLVISQSPTAGSSVTAGSAVDLVISTGPAEWRVLVDGVNQTALVTACSIQWTLNERTRASVVFNDYLPERLAEIVVYARDGVTKIFGGPILSRHVRGYTQRGPDLEVTCEGGDYFAYADWVTVAASYPESTLKVRLSALVTDYLSAYGITLDAGQVDGPTVAPVTWNQKRVSDALRELSNQTGYFLTVSPDKVLLMAPPGDEDAPYVWTLDPLPTHVQEVEWRDLETVPANKIVLTCGPNGFTTIADEHHWGDGVTRIFPLNSPYDAIVGALRTGSDSGGLDPGGFPVGNYPADDMPWTYDATINSLRQRADQPLLAADEFIMLWYQATFPFTVTATTGETPVIEYHEARPDLLSIPAAQQIADAMLVRMSGDPITLSGRFDEDGYRVGQLLTVELADMRALAGTFTIRTISLNLEPAIPAYWRYTLEATEGAIAAPSHLVGWRQIMGQGYAIPGPWTTPPPE